MTAPAFFADPSASGNVARTAAVDAAVDVLILTALDDELQAVLALGAGWIEKRDLAGFPYRRTTFARPGKRPLVVAAAWLGRMGRVDAAIRGGALLRELGPECVAMCGICAGKRGATVLGDVIIADRLYSYDEGKLIAEPGKVPVFQHDIRSYDLHPLWSMKAAGLRREIDIAALTEQRPPSKDRQRRWLLHRLYAQETEGAAAPTDAEQEACCPDWTDVLDEAEAKGLVALVAGVLSLTAGGRELVLNERTRFRKKLPDDPPLGVHVGTIGTGSAVQKDPALFDRLCQVVRSTIGVEMEGAAIGELARHFEMRGLVVKAVSDHGDMAKDDSFRKFACHASAKVLLEFLLRHFDPVRDDHVPEEEPFDERELRGGEDRRDAFLRRVEDVAKLRDPGAKLTRRRAPAPFSGVLEVEVRQGALVDLQVIGALDQPVSEAMVTAYVTEVEVPYRRDNPLLGSTLIHTGAQAPIDLARAARRRGVVLQSFAEYQGLIDFSRYLTWQTSRLEADIVYPPWLYVNAPAKWSLAGGREEQHTEDALATLRELLTEPHRRLGLVLGDFGAGKTFLLHELARRMGKEGGPLVPVLVEMSRLEKQRSLRALLAQHFALANEGRIDLDAFMYMLFEGRIALLFDGFDELALRVTYDRALEHFETVLAAAQGEAKVMVTSRTQYFLTDQEVRLELARRAEQIGGYRLFKLARFEEPQIRRFLGNLIRDPREAEDRYDLLRDVKDLLGLSENPRMLGFIAKIDPEKLKEAKQGGEITAARLYEILIDQWLDFEHGRAHALVTEKGISRARLHELVTRLAGLFWERNAKSLTVGEFGHLLAAEEIEPKMVEHLIGSGSLLVRDPEGRFSFVHRSVMEWLVARAVAGELAAKNDAAALGADEMSDLMADFLICLAGIQAAEQWAYDKGGRSAEGNARKNAARVLKRVEVMTRARGGVEIEIPMILDLDGQDLRGQDWSRVDWQGAGLAGANLEGATLRVADLRGASLVGTKLGRADLEGVKLSGADLTGADLAFARLMGADLRGARGLSAAQLRGAKLVGARGVEVDVQEISKAGAAPSVPREVLPMMAPMSTCHAVAWNRAGDMLASGHDGGLICLWDVVTGQAIRVLHGHAGRVTSVAFSPDGNSLASGSSDRTLFLWDVASGSSLRTYEGHTEAVTSVAFSPDGNALASGSYDKTVRLWDAASNRSLRTYEGHTGAVTSVAFSPDGNALASGSYDKTVRLWDAASKRSLRTYKGHTEAVTSVAFSPDGNALASGSYDKTIRLWDAASKRSLRTYKGHTEAVTSVAFSPDGNALASGSEDKIIRLWDAASNRSMRTYEGHTGAVTSVAFSPDGNALASGSEDKIIRLWDAASNHTLRTYKGHTNWVTSVAFSPDGNALASGSGDNTVRLWDAASKRSLRTYEGHTGAVTSVAFSPDGGSLASGSWDSTVRLWNTASNRPLRTYEGHTNWVTSVAFSPDGNALASGSDDNTVHLWDAASNHSLRTYEGHTGVVTSVAFSPDGGSLASGSWDKTVRLWDAASNRFLRTYEGHTNWVSSVAFSPDGSSLASGSWDKTVRLWDAASSRPLRTYDGHTNWVTSVAFSPDGNALASGSHDRTVRLWDAASARHIRTFTGHLHTVTAVAFSPDGLTLASASADGTIRLWQVATARCLAVILPLREGWVAYTPGGRYKMGGDIAGAFWHVIGLCRFEPGELDPYIPGLRVDEEAPLYALDEEGSEP